MPASEADVCSIPGSGRPPGEGNGNPLQYSCLENSMDRGAWHAAVHGVAKSWARLNDFTFFSLLALLALNRAWKKPFYFIVVLNIFLMLLLFSCSAMSNSFTALDCIPSGSFVHGISQARTLEWIAISFSRGSSQPRG